MADFLCPAPLGSLLVGCSVLFLQHPALKVRVPHQALAKPVEEAWPKCRVILAACKLSYLRERN